MSSLGLGIESIWKYLKYTGHTKVLSQEGKPPQSPIRTMADSQNTDITGALLMHLTNNITHHFLQMQDYLTSTVCPALVPWVIEVSTLLT